MGVSASLSLVALILSLGRYPEGPALFSALLSILFCTVVAVMLPLRKKRDSLKRFSLIVASSALGVVIFVVGRTLRNTSGGEYADYLHPDAYFLLMWSTVVAAMLVHIFGSLYFIARSPSANTASQSIKLTVKIFATASVAGTVIVGLSAPLSDSAWSYVEVGTRQRLSEIVLLLIMIAVFPALLALISNFAFPSDGQPASDGLTQNASVPNGNGKAGRRFRYSTAAIIANVIASLSLAVSLATYTYTVVVPTSIVRETVDDYLKFILTTDGFTLNAASEISSPESNASRLANELRVVMEVLETSTPGYSVPNGVASPITRISQDFRVCLPGSGMTPFFCGDLTNVQLDGEGRISDFRIDGVPLSALLGSQVPPTRSAITWVAPEGSQLESDDSASFRQTLGFAVLEPDRVPFGFIPASSTKILGFHVDAPDGNVLRVLDVHSPISDSLKWVYSDSVANSSTNLLVRGDQRMSKLYVCVRIHPENVPSASFDQCGVVQLFTGSV